MSFGVQKSFRELNGMLLDDGAQYLYPALGWRHRSDRGGRVRPPGFAPKSNTHEKRGQHTFEQNTFINFFHMGPILGFFQSIRCHPRIPMDKRTFPTGFFFPSQSQQELPQTVFPTRNQQVGESTKFGREEPQGLRCLSMIWATCVVEDVSIYLDSLTLEF